MNNEKYVQALKAIGPVLAQAEGVAKEQYLGLQRALDAAIKALEPCQGWENKETWAVALHIDNNQWSYNYRKALLSIVQAEDNTSEVWTAAEYVRFTYAERLKEWVEELISDLYNDTPYLAMDQQVLRSHRKDVGSMAKDVGSLWRVEWQEIADAWISEEANG